MGVKFKRWSGGMMPDELRGGVRVQVEFRNGDIHERASDDFRWDHKEFGASGRPFDVVHYRVIKTGASEDVSQATVSDGGSSDYYKLTIKNKAGEEIKCEMADVIRCVYGDDFNLGNIVKAARRMHLASKGIGKEGTSVTYDANKIKYFADEFNFWHGDF